MKVIVIDYALFARDMEYLLNKNGFKTVLLTSENISVQYFKNLIFSQKPAFVFQINYSPEIAFLATTQGVRYISWTIDPIDSPRLKIIGSTDTSLITNFVHNRGLIGSFNNIGIKNVSYLPLATPGWKRFVVNRNEISLEYICDISFAGVSLAKEKDDVYMRLLNAGLSKEAVEKMLFFLNGFFLKVADSYEFQGLANSSPELVKSVVKALKIENETIEILEALDSFVSYILRTKRVQALEKKHLSSTIKIYGDSHWGQISKNYHGYAEHNKELTTIYNASKINIDFPRIYQRNIATMRVFDILACGGFLISEKNRAVEEIFTDKKHLVFYRDTKEMNEVIDYYLNHEKERTEIAEQGLNFVRENHLMENRFVNIFKGFI